jgi:DNA/RNA endonuclease YhcR with UshA esterase domain
MLKIIHKDNVTDLIDLLTNPNDTLPQSVIDDLDKTPTKNPKMLVVNDDGEVIELNGEVVQGNNFISTVSPQCYVIPDEQGNVRFVYISKKYRVKKDNGEGYKLNK